MVQARTRTKGNDMHRFMNSEQQGTAIVRVRPSKRDSHDAAMIETADIISKIFTEADRNFFKPIRLRMSGSKLDNPYTQHEWVYAAVNAKATAISQVPLLVRRGDKLDPDENSVVVEQGNPWVNLFQNPNSLMTGTQFKEAVEIFLEMFGEALAVVVNANGSEWMKGQGTPDEIWLVHPTNMEHVVDKNTGQLLGWKYCPPGTSSAIAYSTDEVVHWKLFNPDNPFRGLAPVSAILQGVRTDFKAGVFDEALLDNSGSPGGVLTSDMDLHPEQIQAVRSEWNKRHAGSRKAGHTAILGGGMKYTENKFTAKDMQFLEKRKWTREGILGVIGTPPLAVGLDDDVNRATAQVVRRMWWTDKLIPRLHFIAEIINGHFFDPANAVTGNRGTAQLRNLFVRFELSGVEALREDFGEQLEHAAKLKALGYGANEINNRLNLGMQDVPWGEERLENPNQIPVSMLYDAPATFVPIPNQAAVVAEAEGKGLEASQAAIIMVRKLPKGEYRKKRYIAAYKIHFFEPSENRIHTALKRVYQRLKQKTIAQSVAEGNKLAKSYRNGRRSKDGEEEAIGKLRPTDVDKFMLTQKQWKEITEAEMNLPLERVMNDALGQIGGELGGFDVVTPNSKTFTKLHARRIAEMVKVNKSVRRDMRSAILKAISEDGINDVRGVLQELSKRFKQLSEGRAMTIARTETGIIGNTTRYEAMKQEGIEKHEWINAGDQFVRPTRDSDKGDHRTVDGQVVEIGTKFMNGLLHPNDPAGPPEEIINCRCVAVPVID